MEGFLPHPKQQPDPTLLLLMCQGGKATLTYQENELNAIHLPVTLLSPKGKLKTERAPLFRAKYSKWIGPDFTITINIYRWHKDIYTHTKNPGSENDALQLEYKYETSVKKINIHL